MSTMQSAPARLSILGLAFIEDGTPIPGYLLQTSAGKTILIDTGFPK